MKLKFVSCTSNVLAQNVRLPKSHRIYPDVDFESSRSPAKSESWINPNLHCCAVFPTYQYCLYSLVWWMYEIKRAKRLSHAFVLHVTARASLFTDHKISSLPIHAKYEHFKTICEQTMDNSPTDPISSFLHPYMASRLCTIVESFYLQVRNIVLHISLHNLPCHRTMKILFRHQVSPWPLFLKNFQSTRKNPWFEHTSVVIHNILANMTFSLRKMMSVLPNQRLSCVFSTLGRCSVSSQPVLYRPHTKTRTVLFLG